MNRPVPPLPVAGAPSSARPLPPVEQVRPGVWSIPVPLPNTSLGYVLVYVFETDAGPYLVDAGWNTDEAYAALDAGLTAVGTRIQDVRGVLVTHVHPDHYGLAARVRKASGAWVSLSPADAAVLDQLEEPGWAPRLLETLIRCGAPMDVVDRQREQLTAAAVAARGELPRPDVLLTDRARPDVPGWEITALWTPGHSPGHLCFWEPRHRLMLSGDHVLPRITPNVPAPRGEDDTLGAYLRSLDRLDRYPAIEVLPAHEHRFGDLAGRIAELRRHHDQRFAEVLAAVSEGAEVVWDVAARMHWSLPWLSFDGMAQRSAAGEAFAHLRALARRGVLIEEPGETLRWRLAAGG
ncbi:MBL fold metallo-hydrolase [Streptomyces sp. NPDC021080]|uniref:MBL fold metallo-hydrolase n=1 Tax=Streptomyces sp. NPDC021080 TaxID=3365110 RepID=UPI0037B87DDB